MVADLDYDAYRREVARKAGEQVDGFTSVRAYKYKIPTSGSSTAEPIAYPGCTILVKPYPVETLVEPLSKLQQLLKLRTSGFASVPVDTFHVTLADLIAGPLYADLSRDGSADTLHERARRVLAAHTFRRKVEALTYGLGAFHGVVVAIVDFASPEDYDKIRRVRDAVYTDRNLERTGVKKQFPFLGHVTLGYIEEPVANGVAAAVEEARSRHSRTPFSLEAAALFVFPNMSSFHEVA